MCARRCLPFVACAAALVPLRAQTVWTVGPGGFAQLDPAIAAASPGDVIVVAPGVYGAFTLDKALTIAALPGGPVSIMQGPANPVPTVRLRPPVGATACLRGIEVHNPWTMPPAWWARTVIDRGTVCCEDCLFESPNDFQVPGLMVTNARAVLRRCVAIGYGVSAQQPGAANPALQCSNAQVEAIDCWFRGADGAFDFADPRPGVLAQASTLHCVRCAFEGGNETCFTAGPRAGLETSPGCSVWLADCTALGGRSTCHQGAPALQHAGPNQLQFDRCTLTGGSGSTPGAAIVGPATQVPLLGLVGPSSPLARGQPWTIQWRATPATPVIVLAAIDLANPVVPAVVEPVLLPPGATVALAFLLTDGAGAATFATTLPNVPALQHARLIVQGFAGAALPLRTAPPLGYLLR